MNEFLTIIDRFLQSNIVRDISIYDILSNIFKYIFVFIIYSFILHIVRMIYLDIESLPKQDVISGAFLRLINRKETLDYKIEDYYPVDHSLSVGRHRKNDIVLKDHFISKEHARIIKEGDQFYLEDLHSANGTYLNGYRVDEVIPIHDKDIVSFGDAEFLFVKGGERDHAD